MADHVRGPAPRPHREYPQIAAALAAPDPTPALPMDPEFEAKLDEVVRLAEHWSDVATMSDSVEAANRACDEADAARAALWAAVVAYGDRRAEEARGACLAVVEAAMLPPMHPSDHEYLALEMVASELAALSSPAPEGVELTPLYHTLMNDMIEEAPDA